MADAAAALQLVTVIAQAVHQAVVIPEVQGVLQAHELAVAARQAIIAVLTRAAAIQAGHTVLQADGLVVIQREGLLLGKHVIAHVVPHFGTRVVTGNHVEREAVIHVQCLFRQAVKAGCQDAGIFERGRCLRA